jgi:cytidylate kinase
MNANLPALVAELEERDERDMKRAASPLTAAADAFVLDTTHMSIDEVATEVMGRVRERYNIA